MEGSANAATGSFVKLRHRGTVAGRVVDMGIVKNREDARDRYLSGGMHRVQGWLLPEAAILISQLADVQTVKGAVGEIGVHHGKLFLLLELCRYAGEGAVAIDLFDMQDQNIDGSGRGNVKKFRRNLAKFAARPDDVVVHSADSTKLDTESLLGLAGVPFRLFSVDGGHTAEITVSDLQLVASALAPGGLLILDDYFNVEWPGVSEGVNRYLTSGGTLVPIGSGHGKTFFTTEGSAEMYRQEMRRIAQQNNWRSIDQRFHGSTHVVIRTMTTPEKMVVGAKILVRRSPRVYGVARSLRRFLANR